MVTNDEVVRHDQPVQYVPRRGVVEHLPVAGQVTEDERSIDLRLAFTASTVACNELHRQAVVFDPRVALQARVDGPRGTPMCGSPMTASFRRCAINRSGKSAANPRTRPTA